MSKQLTKEEWLKVFDEYKIKYFKYDFINWYNNTNGITKFSKLRNGFRLIEKIKTL
ncbi:hypothetical protein R9B83_02250 [Metamycoplasma equirhinis]|uniref:Uncharacterized protein n=1 Tax=Metamycoplasma equirhinis TaxID=92402 RepID=A0ABZ0P9U5_9BACT|nr:hypothetical protein [Metamycoplasma equirhinis]WPB53792.1 hypothetical protein R9B83_02250 [Metamycoplasma equirhinis]